MTEQEEFEFRARAEAEAAAAAGAASGASVANPDWKALSAPGRQGRADAINKLEHYGKLTGSSLLRGAAALPGLVADIGLAGASQPGYVEAMSGLSPQPPGPLFPATRAIAGAGTQPETTGEKYFSRALEGVGGALGMPTAATLTQPVRTAAIGAMSGLGGEAGSQLGGGEGSTGGQVGSLLGALLAGGGTAAASSFLPNYRGIIKESLGGMRSEDWDKANLVEALMTKERIPHLKSQLLGPGSTLADVVANASAHPKIRPMLVEAIRESGEKSQKSMDNFRMANLPPPIAERDAMSTGVQQAADATHRGIQKQANEAFEAALPAGVSSQVYPAQYMKELKMALINLSKDPEYFNPKMGSGAAIRRMADTIEIKPTQKGQVAAMLKELNQLNSQEGFKGVANEKVKTLLRDFTPEFEDARKAYRDVMKHDMAPFQQSLAGRLAAQGGGPKEQKFTATRDLLGFVFPTSKAQPAAIVNLGRNIGHERVGDILSEHLASRMEQAAKGLDSADMAQTGSRFVEAVYGTRAQRQNLEAAMRVVAKGNGQDPAAISNGFGKLMRALATFKDLKIAPNTSKVNLEFEAGKSAVGTAFAPHTRGSRFLTERTSARTYKKIAEIVTSPNGLKILREIADAPDPKAQYNLIGSLVASVVEGDKEEASQQ